MYILYDSKVLFVSINMQAWRIYALLPKKNVGAKQ